MSTPTFSEWQAELMTHMRRIGEHKGSGNEMIDAAIPYELGMAPEEAALAMLCHDVKAHSRLVEESIRRQAETELIRTCTRANPLEEI